MKVYIVVVESGLTGNVKVSQEGYSSLEAAQAFVNGRTSDCRKWLNEWVCEAKPYTYEIKEISIQ